MSYKITKAEIQNFKNIKSKVIDINGKSLLICGKNEAGKSSFIQALLSPLDVKVRPEKPIMDGEENSVIKVQIAETGGTKEYDMHLYFTEGNQSGRLVVYDENGEKVPTAASILKNMLGKISFDVFAFLRDSKEKQIKAVKELSGREEEIDVVEAEIAKHKEDISYSKKKSEEMLARANTLTFTEGQLKQYAQPIESAELNEKLKKAQEEITRYNNNINTLSQLKADRERIKGSIDTRVIRGEELRKQLETELGNIQLEKIQIESLTGRIEKGEKYVSSTPPPSMAAIEEEMKSITDHNAMHGKVKEALTLHKEQQGLNDKIENTKLLVKTKLAERNKIISNSDFKVEGVTLEEDGLYYKGLPLSEQQINTASVIDLGMEFSMALNKNLRVFTIKDGSLLDKKSLQRIIKKVEDNDYQVLIELVSDETDTLEIKFTEEAL